MNNKYEKRLKLTNNEGTVKKKKSKKNEKKFNSYGWKYF